MNDNFFDSKKLCVIYTKDYYLKIKLLNLLTEKTRHVTNYEFMKPFLLKILYTVFLKKVLTSKTTNRIVSHSFKFFRKDVKTELNSLGEVNINTALLDRNYISSLILNTIHETLTEVT